MYVMYVMYVMYDMHVMFVMFVIYVMHVMHVMHVCVYVWRQECLCVYTYMYMHSIDLIWFSTLHRIAERWYKYINNEVVLPSHQCNPGGISPVYQWVCFEQIKTSGFAIARFVRWREALFTAFRTTKHKKWGLSMPGTVNQQPHPLSYSSI